MPWETRYRTAAITTDLLSLTVASGLTGGLLAAVGNEPVTGSRLSLIPITILAGTGALLMRKAWDHGVLGQGAEEYRRLGRALVNAMVVVALVCVATGIPGVRWWVFATLPAAGLLAFPLRYGLRKVLHARRLEGACMLPVIAAGDASSVTDLIERVRREPHNGWRVEAVCAPGGPTAYADGLLAGVPVVGSTDAVAHAARAGTYRVVAITADAQWTSTNLQRLTWDLENTSADLVVAPVLLEVAGPRLHVAPVFGLPLLRLSAPAFTGPRRAVKEITDRGLAAVLLVLTLPVMLLVAGLVAVTSTGPVLYRQQRVGKGGSTFTMLKFRTMVANAESRRTEVLGRNDAAGPLFKLRQDPRVTRVGAFLRRFSLDELPQLLNVLGGSMSLVGPRPPLGEEVRLFGPESLRRLMVKPGLTGLWQVSGRSDLSWEEAVRLDLRYVENWSLALDLVILWKTARAVVRGQGAY